MEKYSKVEELSQKIQSSCLTIGTFDGIHQGHNYLLKKLVDKSRAHSNKSVLITFNPNPYVVINNVKKKDYHIATAEEKHKSIEQLGVDILLELSFTKRLSSVTAQEFLREYVITPFNPNNIVIGFNHHFGLNREGTPEYLKSQENKYNYKLEIVNPFKYNDEIISSSYIRELIRNGDIIKVNKFLGRNYSISGRVVKGESIGREMSFPTANIDINTVEKLIPKRGVYCIKARTNNNFYHGMCNIGDKPTFKDNGVKTIEAHIFNYTQFDLYSQFIDIEFVDYVRNEKKFSSKQDLKIQLMKDKEYCMSLI